MLLIDISKYQQPKSLGRPNGTKPKVLKIVSNHQFPEIGGVELSVLFEMDGNGKKNHTHHTTDLGAIFLASFALWFIQWAQLAHGDHGDPTVTSQEKNGWSTVCPDAPSKASAKAVAKAKAKATAKASPKCHGCADPLRKQIQDLATNSIEKMITCWICSICV